MPIQLTDEEELELIRKGVLRDDEVQEKPPATQQSAPIVVDGGARNAQLFAAALTQNSRVMESVVEKMGQISSGSSREPVVVHQQPSQQPQQPTQWRFRISRDQDGLITEVIASPLEAKKKPKTAEDVALNYLSDRDVK